MKEYVTKGYALDFGFVVFSSYKDAEKNGGIFPYPSAQESIVGGNSGYLLSDLMTRKLQKI